MNQNSNYIKIAICDIILFFVCQVGGYLAEVKTTSQMELLLGLAGMQAITQPPLYNLVLPRYAGRVHRGAQLVAWAD